MNSLWLYYKLDNCWTDNRVNKVRNAEKSYKSGSDYQTRSDKYLNKYIWKWTSNYFLIIAPSKSVIPDERPDIMEETELVWILSRKATHSLAVWDPNLAEHLLTRDDGGWRTEIFSGQCSKSFKSPLISLPPLQRPGTHHNHWLFQAKLQLSLEAGLGFDCVLCCSKKLCIQTVHKSWSGTCLHSLLLLSAIPLLSLVFAEVKALPLKQGSRTGANTKHFVSSALENRFIRLSTIVFCQVLMPAEDGPSCCSISLEYLISSVTSSSGSSVSIRFDTISHCAAEWQLIWPCSLAHTFSARCCPSIIILCNMCSAGLNSLDDATCWEAKLLLNCSQPLFGRYEVDN